ncbi:MAG: lipid II flippase MurJ, partial [Myxococcota bacterium]
ADRFFQLPLGVFGIAIATASLPALADAHLEGGASALAHTLRRSLELNAFIAIPSTAGLFVLALPICSTVLQHGAFSHAQAVAAADVLRVLAFGLLPVASIRVVSQGFFSIQDTRTPVACSAIGVGANLALAPMLAPEYGAAGLAMSLTASAWIQLLVQLILLRRRLAVPLGVPALSGRVARASAVAALMAASAWTVSLLGTWSEGLELGNFAVLALAVAIGVAVYAAFQLLIRTPEATLLAS